MASGRLRGRARLGVDAGNLSVVDYPAYADTIPRVKEEIFAGYGQRRPDRQLLDFGAGPVGVIADSGWGDGAYPAYWGVDADGAVMQLVIDFMVLVVEDGGGRLRHLP